MAHPVGLVGVGKMGSALLARLDLAGNRVKAYDIAETAMDAAREAGAETVASAADAARGVPFVHVFVHSDEEVIDATMGPKGVLKGAAAGTLVFLHSTIMPETTHRVAEAAAKQDVDVLDATVTSVPRRVRTGEATFLVGGPEDVVAVARPHLESLGKAVYHFGPRGTGNIAKLAKNLTNAVERVMLSETLQIVEAGGLDVEQFLEMARSVDGGSLIGHWEKNFIVEDGHAIHRPAAGLFNKDVPHVAKLAESLHLDTPVTRGTAETAARWIKAWAEAKKTAQGEAAE